MSNRELIDQNYEIMQLYSPTISYTNKKSIDYQIENFEFEVATLNVVKMLFADGQGSISINELYALFKNLSKEQI